MNFILSLAHFCEIHGPTSIVCTQAIPPSCVTCFPPSATSVNPSPITPHQPFVPGPQSTGGVPQLLGPNCKPGPSHNVSGSSSVGLRPNTSPHGASANSSSASSSNLSSPMETPPPSPRSPMLTSSSLPAAAAGIGIGPGYLGGPANPGSTAPPPSSAMADTCRSCSITLPSRVSEKLSAGSPASSPIIGARPAAGKGKSPVLRTKEPVASNTSAVSSEDEDEGLEGQLPSYPRRQRRQRRETIDPSHLSSPPTPRSYFNSAPASDDEATGGKSSAHRHYVTYLSTRAPSLPSRYTTLRQSCVRTLSCELIPAQTGPIMFGDPLAGYTIAYVFRLADSGARGGRRSYALLCICPDQKTVVKSWKCVVATFGSLVQRIKVLAAKKVSEDTQAPPALSNSISSITSRGPDSFLRRAPGEGGSQKGLAELVGREELFVDVHTCFVKLLGALVRRHGCWAVSELGLGTGLGSAFATPIMGRSRAGSMSSAVGIEERRAFADGHAAAENVEASGGERMANEIKSAFPTALSSMAALSVSNSVVESRVPPSATPRTPTVKREEEGSSHHQGRNAILIH